MGGCFSSGLSNEELNGEQTPRHCRRQKVRPSDEDGKWWPYVGEWDVDNKASIFIDNFHRHQSGCAEQPAPAS